MVVLNERGASRRGKGGGKFIYLAQFFFFCGQLVTLPPTLGHGDCVLYHPLVMLIKTINKMRSNLDAMQVRNGSWNNLRDKNLERLIPSSSYHPVAFCVSAGGLAAKELGGLVLSLQFYDGWKANKRKRGMWKVHHI